MNQNSLNKAATKGLALGGQAVLEGELDRSIQIQVKYFTTLREIARTNKEIFHVKNGERISTIIENMASKYGKEAYEYLHDKSSGKIDPSIKFLINGIDVQRLQGLKTRLRDGDVVAIIPPIGGGLSSQCLPCPKHKFHGVS